MALQVSRVVKRSLLSAVWAVSFVMLGEGKVKLTGHWRDDSLGHPKPGQDTFTLVEDPEQKGKRIVTHLVVGPVVSGDYGRLEERADVKKFEVVNPENIFGYGPPERIPGTAADE